MCPAGYLCVRAGHLIFGGRPRTRTLDPLIKSRMISQEDQTFVPTNVSSKLHWHTIDFPLVGMGRAACDTVL
jgi:hypothetical protein